MVSLGVSLAVGGTDETPESLLRKAAKFVRLATGASDPEMVAQLTHLAELYTEAAADMERAASRRSYGNE
jgi:hypothetical protein